ncbi:hypothetical protein ACP4OV_011717 [Aristida adscensionis]
MGGLEIKSDSDSGRKFLLSEFGKSSMPPISCFGNMLKEESLSDEKTFIYFMIVALSSFLCPTSNIHPSSKYFAIFADLNKVKCYDWCKYIIDWLMEMIAKFSVENKCTGRKSKSLGGCIYYIAVCYLDFVDFGALQVQGGFPRISVWKGEMIKSYSELDQLPESVYEKRPLRNFSSTCYNQAPARLQPTAAVNDDIARQDFDFRKALDDIFGNIFSTEVNSGWYKHHQDECDNYNQKSKILVLEILKYLHTHFCNEIFSSKSHVNGVANVSTNDNSSGSCPMQEFDEVLKEHMRAVEASNEKKTAEVGADNVDDDEVKVLYEKKANLKSCLRPNPPFLAKTSSVPTKSALKDDSIPFSLPQKTLLNAFNEVANDNSAKRTSDLPSVSPKHADANKDCAAEHNFHFSSGAHKSPFPVKPKENSEVQIVAEVKFSDKCANLSKKAEAIYNERNGLNCDGSKSIEVSTSGGKLPVHGPRRLIYPNKAACGPFVMNSKSYPSVEARRFYAIICKIGHNKNCLVAFG